MSVAGLLVGSVALPALLAALSFAAARGVFRRLRGAGGDRAAAALGVGLGTLAGCAAVARPVVPPVDVTDRVYWLAAAAALYGLVGSLVPAPAWARWVGRLLLSALVVGATFGPVLGVEDAPGPA